VVRLESEPRLGHVEQEQGKTMETSIPVSITIVGHPLIKTVTVAWSANTGMVPQALCFGSEGGSAEAQLISDNPTSAMVCCQVQVDFAIDRWELVSFQQSLPVNAGGDRIVIDPGNWIHYLSLQLQNADETAIQTDLETDDSHLTDTNHLIVNFVWETARLVHPVKLSQRMKSNQVWEIPYLCIFPQDRVSATISAFGVMNRQMVKMKPRSILLAAQLAPAKLRLSASQNQVQLLPATVS
jgi:hypothetical protein